MTLPGLGLILLVLTLTIMPWQTLVDLFVLASSVDEDRDTKLIGSSGSPNNLILRYLQSSLVLVHF